MLNGLLSTGQQALMNAQVGIAVTSDNIANADTEGYARRTVSYVTAPSITVRGVSIGTGAQVEEIRRNYDSLLESSYLAANSQAAAWSSQAAILYTVESLFSDASGYGPSTALDSFLSSLADLADSADDAAARQEAISYAETLADSLAMVQSSLQDQLDAVEQDLAAGVAEANQLMDAIAGLNTAIVARPEDLELQDQRDTAVRELSSLLDVQVIEHDDASYTVLTSSGQTLVDGGQAYALTLEGPQVRADLRSASSFEGQLYVSGASPEELLVQCVTPGAADGSATYRVSLDGGETWLTDEDGQTLEFSANGWDERVEVAGLELWFGSADDPYAAATGNLASGDSFDVMAKSGVYWHGASGGSVNITPISGGDERDNRLSGGELAGLVAARDQELATYQADLEGLAHELIWQVNVTHSQGAGLEHWATATATNAVDDASAALADSSLDYADHLAAGTLSLALYDEETGESLGVQGLDFSSITPGTPEFDPTLHSLDDVAAALNATFPGQVTASVSDGQLTLEAADGPPPMAFEFAGDETGLLAALGINCFFTGKGVADLGVDQALAADTDRLACARVGSDGLVASGDNSNALALAAVADAEVGLDSLYAGADQTLAGHLHALVARVGGDADTTARNATQATVLAENLAERQQEVAGVSLDEELANLTRYQQAYQAASVIIQTTNELFDTVMSLKS